MPCLRYLYMELYITMEFEEVFWIWEGVGNVSHLKTKGVGKWEESSCIFKVGRRPLHIFGAVFGGFYLYFCNF